MWGMSNKIWAELNSKNRWITSMILFFL
jgi:hypothetical protein